MQSAPDWKNGEAYLRENAPELKRIMDRAGSCTMRPDPVDRWFQVLSYGIISQQLPPEAGEGLLKNLQKQAGSPVRAEKVLELSDEEMEACGLSRVKAGYLREFARMLLEGEVDFSLFPGMTDSQIVKELKKVKGLGQWTVEMFLLLSLCRPDVLPGDDFLLKKKVQELYGLKTIPKRGELIRQVEHWHPWRSLAVWYLWQVPDTKKGDAR